MKIVNKGKLHPIAVVINVDDYDKTLIKKHNAHILGQRLSKYVRGSEAVWLGFSSGLNMQEFCNSIESTKIN